MQSRCWLWSMGACVRFVLYIDHDFIGTFFCGTFIQKIREVIFLSVGTGPVTLLVLSRAFFRVFRMLRTAIHAPFRRRVFAPSAPCLPMHFLTLHSNLFILGRKMCTLLECCSPPALRLIVVVKGSVEGIWREKMIHTLTFL